MKPVSVVRGDGPLVLGLPHAGTWIPDEIGARLTPRGAEIADTDWHVDRLYSGLLPGATLVRANFHRYVIDANRDPLGGSLYPGQNTTALVPLTDFDGAAIWRQEPDAGETEARRAMYHAPYHAALKAELQRVRARHGVVILYDCHSIRSRIPFLFDGTLADFNIGTNGTTTCAARVERAVQGVCEGAGGYTAVTNGRFRGGWATRHYGRPETGMHAIQMELAQSTYLETESPPWRYEPVRAGALRAVLSDILQTLAELAPQLART